ncbi:MAG: hypothetical protein Q8M16_09315 [Pirellulaceae bacterium]|nr:hypothetical protein [Pirellulaceae bacterium]
MTHLIDIAYYYAPSIMLALGWCGVVQIARGDAFGIMMGVVLFAIGGTGFLLLRVVRE